MAHPADIMVILPTLGERLDTLEQALLSVQRQRQDVSLRLIVVVPAGKSAAIALARQFDADIIEDHGGGMSAAINQALAARQGETWSIWLGDDDQYRPGGLKTLLDLASSNPDAVVVYGGCDYVDSSGSTVWTSRAGWLASALVGFGPNLIPHPAALIRLDALEAVGGYDPSLSLVMDLDVFLRLKRRGRFAWTTKTVSAFGWHPESLTVSDRKKSAAEARSVKRRHLPPALRIVEPLWEYPVQWASALAAHRVNQRSHEGSAG